MIYIDKNTTVPKGFKLPRRKKKEFKKYWLGMKVSVTLTPDSENRKNSEKDARAGIVNMLYSYYMLDTLNLKEYKGIKTVNV